jgi:hypothetical protein
MNTQNFAGSQNPDYKAIACIAHNQMRYRLRWHSKISDQPNHVGLRTNTKRTNKKVQFEPKKPPLTKNITNEYLQQFENGVLDMKLFEYSWHTQGTERCFCLVSEASASVCGPINRVGQYLPKLHQSQKWGNSTKKEISRFDFIILFFLCFYIIIICCLIINYENFYQLMNINNKLIIDYFYLLNLFCRFFHLKWILKDIKNRTKLSCIQCRKKSLGWVLRSLFRNPSSLDFTNISAVRFQSFREQFFCDFSMHNLHILIQT